MGTNLNRVKKMIKSCRDFRLQRGQQGERLNKTENNSN